MYNKGAEKFSKAATGPREWKDEDSSSDSDSSDDSEVA